MLLSIVGLCSFDTRDYIKLDNGDYVIDEKTGSVCEELTSYGFDLVAYQTGFYLSDKAFMLSESYKLDKLYFYVYVTDEKRNFNKIDIATKYSNGGSVDVDENTYSWETYDILLSSFSPNEKIRKYEVIGLTPLDNPNRSYAVRQIYSADDVLGVGCTYICNGDQTQVLRQNMITITDKVVYFNLLNLEGWMKPKIFYYCAFNLNVELKNITRIRVVYDTYKYVMTEYPTIWDSPEHNDQMVVNFGDNSFDGINHFLTNFKGMDSFCPNSLVEPTIEKDVEQLIDAGESYEFNSYNGWFRKKTYKWDSIMDLSSYEFENPNKDVIDNYQWAFMFGSKDGYELTRMAEAHHSDIGDKRSQSVDNFVDIKDLSVMDIWYEEQGEIRHAIVADSYTSSSGHADIHNPNDDGFLQQLKEFINWVGKHFLEIIFSIIGLVIGLPLLITLFPYIIKIIALIITLVFKIVFSPILLISYLIKKRKSKKVSDFND